MMLVQSPQKRPWIKYIVASLCCVWVLVLQMHSFPRGTAIRLARRAASLRGNVTPSPCSLQPGTLPFLDMGAHNKAVIVIHFDMTAAPTQLWHAMQSWVQDAFQLRVGVVPVISNAAHAKMEFRINTGLASKDEACLWNVLQPAFVLVNSDQGTTPSRPHVPTWRSLQRVAQLSQAPFVVRVDDDAYVNVPRLLEYVEGLDEPSAGAPIVWGEPRTHGEHAFCDGPVVIYSAPLLQAAATSVLDWTKCDRKFASQAAEGGYSVDDAMTSHCLMQATGAGCLSPRPPASFRSRRIWGTLGDTGSGEFAVLSGVHGKCFEAIHRGGGNVGKCDRHAGW